MENTHTLEDTLEEGEARRIAMLGQTQNDAMPPAAELAHGLRSTPIYVRIIMLITASIVLMVSGFINAILLVATDLYFLPHGYYLGDMSITTDVYYVISLIPILVTLIITYSVHKALRTTYAKGTRGIFELIKQSTIECFRGIIFKIIIILVAADFAAVVINFLMCLSYESFCPTIGKLW